MYLKGELENGRDEMAAGPLRASIRAGRPRDLAIEAIVRESVLLPS